MIRILNHCVVDFKRRIFLFVESSGERRKEKLDLLSPQLDVGGNAMMKVEEDCKFMKAVTFVSNIF